MWPHIHSSVEKIYKILQAENQLWWNTEISEDADGKINWLAECDMWQYNCKGRIGIQQMKRGGVVHKEMQGCAQGNAKKYQWFTKQEM